MSSITDAADLLARIDTLDAESVRLHSDLSGPMDLATSLREHFNQALGFTDLFPVDLSDHDLHQQLTEAFAREPAREHFNRTLRRPAGSQVEANLVATLQVKLAHIVITATDASLIAGLNEGLPNPWPYASCSLAQALWARRVCLTQRDCFVAAALLLYPSLPTPPQPPRSASRPLVLDNYLDLPTLARHLLKPPAGVHLAVHLFNAFGATVYAQGRRYRPPTAREREAGVTPDQNGKAFLPGPALNAPAAQALDALLHSSMFTQWAGELAASAEWDASSDHLALAEQTLIDVLYPPDDRQPGLIMAFDLFSPDNATLPVEEIRLDLINSVQIRLACTPAIAQLAGELLMRRFAPELLLSGYPADFNFEPDLRWASIRQGALILSARQQPMTFDNAEEVMRQALQENDPVPEEALRQTLAVWAPLRGSFELPPPWSHQQWQLALHRYLAVRDVESLNDLPDRFEEARRQLLQSRIAPESRNADGQVHLLMYLDHGAGYRSNPRLPDVTAWYEVAFGAWEQRATNVYQAILHRCLSHLPEDIKDRLRDGPWTAYAVTWPIYVGPDNRPEYGSSPRADWHMQTATQGFVVHVPGTEGDWLYELFPERLHWQAHFIAHTAPTRLAEQLTLLYSEYNQSQLPWIAADFPALRQVLIAPTQDRLDSLARHYASDIALGNRDALHALGKGATPHEQFLARRQSVSTGRYLQRLFSNLIPGLSCLNPEDGSDALACVLDIAALKGAAVTLGGRAFKPLAKLPGVLGQSANTARLNAARAARRWSSIPVTPDFSERLTPPKRWRSAPELTTVAPESRELMTQRRVLPGQTPDAVLLDQIPGSHGPVPHELPETATLIPRDNATVDAIIHGAAYRLQPPNTSGLVRRVAHEPLLGQPPTEVRPPYPGGEARMALSFSPLPNDAGTPVFGQHVSHAFQTVRIEPVPIRYRPQHTRFYIWAQVMVREGKVVVHAPNHPRRLKPLPVEETQLRLGVISPPVYHRRIVVDPSPELRFGLPADMPIEQVRQITEYCPPVRLGGLARTIPDRRTLRGALIDWRGEQWLIVEADLGVFYGAPHQPWAWQTRLLDAPALPASLPHPPRGLRRRFERITDHEAIERYLEISETYRIVAERPNLQRDVDNVVRLLRDWIEQGRTWQLRHPSRFLQFIEAMESRLLPEYARNILTQSAAQDALAGPASRGIAALNREIVPIWRQFHSTSAADRQHILGVLDDLLPARGATTPYTPAAGAQSLDDNAMAALRQHLYPVNLAFASVTLKDHSRVVFFALSGSPGRRALHIIPTPRLTPAVDYVDARQINQFFPPDPRFTELPILRRADFLWTRVHKRHLDAERHIASALNRRLLHRHTEVERIDVFTMLDSCRSCGGFVLPRLRLDYPQAEFSVTWMLDYTN